MISRDEQIAANQAIERYHPLRNQALRVVEGDLGEGVQRTGEERR